jgi:hypothetical protein
MSDKDKKSKELHIALVRKGKKGVGKSPTTGEGKYRK